MSRILTPRELAALLPDAPRPVSELEAARLMRMYSSQESDRVPPPSLGLADVLPLRRRVLSDAELDALLNEPHDDDDDESPRPWPPPRRQKGSG